MTGTWLPPSPDPNGPTAPESDGDGLAAADRRALPLVAGRSMATGPLAWILIGLLGAGIFGWLSVRRVAAAQTPIGVAEVKTIALPWVRAAATRASAA